MISPSFLSLSLSQLQHAKRVNHMQTPGHFYSITDVSVVAAAVQTSVHPKTCMCSQLSEVCGAFAILDNHRSEIKYPENSNGKNSPDPAQ